MRLPSGKAAVEAPEERPQLDLPDELKVEVKGFKISGQDIFPEEKLQAILAPRKDKLLSFKDLEDGADDLAAYFRKEGYLAVRVYLPVQKITNGIVEYAIIWTALSISAWVALAVFVPIPRVRLLVTAASLPVPSCAGCCP